MLVTNCQIVALRSKPLKRSVIKQWLRTRAVYSKPIHWFLATGVGQWVLAARW